jgi:hypothetical protein
MAHQWLLQGAKEGEGDAAVPGVPSPETMKACGGDELRRERGGKEGGVGCGEMRRGPGAFYRCRGGGRRPGDGDVKAAPLMVFCASYQKRGRRRWPIKEG